MEPLQAFEYLSEPHTPKHGPRGYCQYESFRDWLRDEFSFRCAFCLWREPWGQRRGMFHIDHSRPLSQYPEGRCEFDNLLYVCAGCNVLKRAISLPDPRVVPFGRCMHVEQDGSIRALNETGLKLIRVLRLNNEEHIRFRAWMLSVLQLLVRDHHRELLVELLGYPADLPDLRRKRKVDNSRPEGLDRCCYALRERGELSEIY